MAVSRVGGLQHLVGEGTDGVFFTPGDAADCAARLRALVADGAQRRRLGEAGCRKAREVYSWSRIADATEQIYLAAEERVAASNKR